MLLLLLFSIVVDRYDVDNLLLTIHDLHSIIPLIHCWSFIAIWPIHWLTPVILISDPEILIVVVFDWHSMMWRYSLCYSLLVGIIDWLSNIDQWLRPDVDPIPRSMQSFIDDIIDLSGNHYSLAIIVIDIGRLSDGRPIHSWYSVLSVLLLLGHGSIVSDDWPLEIVEIDCWYWLTIRYWWYCCVLLLMTVVGVVVIDDHC